MGHPLVVPILSGDAGEIPVRIARA
jgi:hypothetical protein